MPFVKNKQTNKKKNTEKYPVTYQTESVGEDEEKQELTHCK